ncbi:Radical SAM superfamily enzyme, MoaA/NifB/PqqE/SkfB family [Anaerocolumna jejuensis DSM 15929]|uniref:Radical SAM superfamily enzyme, MoaA/NifB/PqqE/SkfB family n=1 Tax=Anaerocolumna jejuensis DSM 15929 TaxID=1121322 RepID=A0A1M6JCS3_9FIRM|nr:radical SAM protein [Anaerocolumna jejuensis]SHJ44412.1 Radical SAM superfamily enzyme, MoaA/NifB/PqqE/SkfB family [Anaerocolumna jejuensis DSM 15929]
MNLKEKASTYVLEKAFSYIAGNPKENLPKLMKWADDFDIAGNWKSQRELFHSIVDDTENTWYNYILSLFKDIDSKILQATFQNFLINASMIGYPKQRKMEENLDCNIPWAILMDPTSACNLKCTGCWAAEYGNKLNMTYEELDSIINQANELGTYFFLYSGGEPLVRKADLIRLCEAHPGCQFAAFTNGTLIDETFADDMLRVKNFIPAISVEGFESDTDFRRGNGTFRKVEKAMRILKEKKLPFGISCCYTSKNVDMIGSEEYFDQMIAWGAKFCWFFTYMPVGNEAVPELMVTSEQREFMYHQIHTFRETKPIFTLDFWNDGEYSGGCLAGGRRYLHINANGDMEPCAFIHYSDSNIREKTLLEALQSPLFKAYRKNQPFNENHLRPCPLLDNPEELPGMVEESGAHSTDLQNPENVHNLAAKCHNAADNWAVTADKIWECSGHCDMCTK